MKAYLKKDPTRIGEIAYVYKTDTGQKRLTVFFELFDGSYSHSIDAAIEEFEVIPEEIAQ